MTVEKAMNFLFWNKHKHKLISSVLLRHPDSFLSYINKYIIILHIGTKNNTFVIFIIDYDSRYYRHCTCDIMMNLKEIAIINTYYTHARAYQRLSQVHWIKGKLLTLASQCNVLILCWYHALYYSCFGVVCHTFPALFCHFTPTPLPPYPVACSLRLTHYCLIL